MAPIVELVDLLSVKVRNITDPHDLEICGNPMANKDRMLLFTVVIGANGFKSVQFFLIINLVFQTIILRVQHRLRTQLHYVVSDLGEAGCIFEPLPFDSVDLIETLESLDSSDIFDVTASH